MLKKAHSLQRQGMLTKTAIYTATLSFPAQNYIRIFHTRKERIPGYAWVVFLMFLPGIILI